VTGRRSKSEGEDEVPFIRRRRTSSLLSCGEGGGGGKLAQGELMSRARMTTDHWGVYFLLVGRGGGDRVGSGFNLDKRNGGTKRRGNAGITDEWTAGGEVDFFQKTEIQNQRKSKLGGVEKTSTS